MPPRWVLAVSGWCAASAALIVVASIALHLCNYRKPFDQRLMVRIQLIVPLFALSCYAMLRAPHAAATRYALEPLREIYESFVIYTFFSLLTQMLGGERNIIISTSGRAPVAHPGPLRWVLAPMDISDPYTFLNIKRGILQYVWLKPAICFAVLATQASGYYDAADLGWAAPNLWLNLVYNASVSLSLYCLALFWKILWVDLKPFNPVGKFLCVKLIIFASYWQGVVLAVVQYARRQRGGGGGGGGDAGTAIQNALLCVELVFFAIGHWLSFSYRPFTIRHIPNGRLQLRYAVKDAFGVADLAHDFRLTFYGDYYQDYQHFDSVEAMIAHPESRGRMSRIEQGLRYHSDGRQKHWLGAGPSPPGADAAVRSSAERQALGPSSSRASNRDEFALDDEVYAQARAAINNYNLDQDKVRRLLNYPIVDEVVPGHVFGHKVQRLRRERAANYGAADV
ncbi:DUF300-domain-containing protein [[Candida] zeylanoides]